MVAEAFWGEADIFASQRFRIVPCGIYSVFCFFRIIFFVLGELLLTHDESSIVSNQITVLYVFIDMLGVHIFLFAECLLVGGGQSFFAGPHCYVCKEYREKIIMKDYGIESLLWNGAAEDTFSC